MATYSSTLAWTNSCLLSQWGHPTISSSVVPFSSCLQSFPASGSFPISQLFASGGQSIGASASASVLPVNIQNRFSFGLTDLISLLSKGFSRAFSSTIVCKHQFLALSLLYGLILTSMCIYRACYPRRDCWVLVAFQEYVCVDSW